MFDRQTKKFCSAVVDALPELPEAVMQRWIGNPTDLQKVLCDGLCLLDVVSTPEPMLDFIVRVDRSVKPTYPDQVKKVMHPELECSGPTEYNLQSDVEQWLHDDQKRGSVEGNTIYKHLQKDDNLATCLNLQDGLAIQEKGIVVFRKLFAGNAVFLWGSVMQDQDGYLVVPCLIWDGGKVVVSWGWLDIDWSSSHPALRFRLPAQAGK